MRSLTSFWPTSSRNNRFRAGRTKDSPSWPSRTRSKQPAAAELQEPLEAGRVFDLRKLMAMDYPEAKEWSLYYAQSVSLTRFLVEQGSPEKFVQFVQNSLRDGTEGALRGTYGIGGFAELQEKWIEYARQQLTADRQAGRDTGSQPAGIEVK